jgi:hypothetical protein
VNKSLVRLAALLVLLAPCPARAQVNVGSTLNKHNLSTTGPGPVKATVLTEICVFCHTPHNANPAVPLWNQTLSSGVTYLPYTSTTLKATVGLPTGSSKLCLACHDGTVALGSTINNGRIPMQGLNAQGQHRPAQRSSDFVRADRGRTDPPAASGKPREA